MVVLAAEMQYRVRYALADAKAVIPRTTQRTLVGASERNSDDSGFTWNFQESDSGHGEQPPRLRR